MADDVKNQYGEELTKIGAIGFSAMMHGYMAFDENKELLVPFRTWRNSITGKAAAELTSLLTSIFLKDGALLIFIKRF